MALSLKQLQDRKKGLGGSDAAAILDLSPWKTPIDIFFDKLDTGEPEQRDTTFTKWGNRLETVIVQKFQDEIRF